MVVLKVLRVLKVCGVWCVVCGVWCVVCGLSPLLSGLYSGLCDTELESGMEGTAPIQQRYRLQRVDWRKTCLKCLAATRKYDFCFHNPNPTPTPRTPEP
jgi:hypothetical protein